MANQFVDVLGAFKGMNTDVLPEQIQEGEYTFALNAVIEPGNLIAIATEGGTIECLNDVGYIIGKQYVPGKDILIAFVVDENNTNSRIVSIDLKRCKSKVLFQSDCLNFDINKQIATTYKQLESCGDIVVVFTEKDRPIRYYNIDKSVTDCEELNLFTCSESPNISILSVSDSGGALPSGKYWFFSSYCDEFGNLEAVTGYTQEVPIYDDSLSSSWSTIDGCPANTLTSKSVNLKFSELSPNKEFVALIVVASIDYQLLTKKIVLRYDRAPEYFYTYAGEVGTPIPLEEISITSSKYLSAELVTQHSDRLILGRLKNVQQLDYQKQANQIKVKWFTSKLSVFGTKSCEIQLTGGILIPLATGYTIRRELQTVKLFFNGNFSLAGDVYNTLNYIVTTLKYGIRFLDQTGFEYFARQHISNITIVGDLVTFDYLFDTDVTEEVGCSQPWVTGTSFPPFTTRNLMTGGSTPLIYVIEAISIEGDGFKVYKNPLTSLYKSFLGNENYALSLWWEFCDGTFSNAFHIPGTSLETVNECFKGVKSFIVIDGGDSTEEVFYPNADSIVSPNDINNPFNCEKYVWEIFDTSCIEEEPFEESKIVIDHCGNIVTNEIGIWQKGTLGYYEETCLTYPQTTDCDDVPIYPHTIEEDGSIVMDNVRHHKIPSRRTISHFASNNNLSVEHASNIAHKKPYQDIDIFPIGLEVYDITPPESPALPVVGYHLGFVKRERHNSSVIGKGIIFSSFYYSKEDVGTGYFFRQGINSDQNKKGIFTNADLDASTVTGTTQYPTPNVPYQIFSPDLHFDIPLLNGEFVQVEQEWYGHGVKYGIGDVPDYLGQALNINMEGITVLPTLDVEASDSVNRLITAQSYLGLNESLSGLSGLGGAVYNADGVSTTVLTLNSKRTDPVDGIFKFINNCSGSNIEDNSIPTPFYGTNEVFVECAKAHYASVRKLKCNQYGDISGLKYIPSGYFSENPLQSSIRIFGDSFINYWAFFKTSFLVYDLGINNLASFLTTLVHGVYESNINVDLRHEGSSELGEVYYPKLANNDWGIHSSISAQPPEKCLLEQFVLDTTTEGGDTLRLGKDNMKFYNLDYSRLLDLLLYYAPSYNYKPCECNLEQINTIAISEVHNEVSDGWKVFRPANILTIPRNTGEVMNLFSFSNSLFAHTTDNLWRIFTTQDRVFSDTSTVYIGSGSIFGQEPQYLYMSGEGYGGIQQMHGWYQNNLGYFWIDQKAGKLFNLTEGGLKELSAKKLQNWFRENLIPGIDFEGYVGTDNFANPEGIGWHIGYDYTIDRILVTFRNYKLLNPELFNGLYSEVECEVGKIYYNKLFNKFVIITDTDCSYSFVSLQDKDYFCDLSWTLSFSMITDHWVSYHSYIPLNYLGTRTKLYSNYNKLIQEHNNKEIFSTYYGQYRKHIVEFVSKKSPITANIWTSLAYNSEAKIYVGGRYKDVLETYSHLIAWHENDLQQNTGKLILLNRKDTNPSAMEETITDIPGSVKIYKRYGSWYLNGLYNFIKDQEEHVWNTECTEISLDKEIINDNIDFLKDYIYLDRLRSNHLMFRFIMDNPEKNNVKIITKYLMPMQTQS